MWSPCPTIAQMSSADVERALKALDGAYIQLDARRWHAQVYPRVCVVDITPAARRAVGMWPTAESAAINFLASLDEHIETSADPDRRTKLIKMRDALGGTARDVFVDVMGAVVSKSLMG